MTAPNNTEIQNRFFAALPYVLPLVYVYEFGEFLFNQFPYLQLIYLPLEPIKALYSTPLVGLVIFFALIFAVVRNENIPHLIRFNTMQAILLDILLILIRLAIGILAPGLKLGGGLLIETFFNMIFLGILATCTYAIVQSARGIYAELPAISEAVHGQVR
ncbi:MAG: hypothetical protein BRC33_04565 [Cyanobacteria bacterium SW_9_44_58]|nr:MAG: hypothetical protein BRC33_04565 [Cyanobacteria bacterium SW_9_44_58]